MGPEGIEIKVWIHHYPTCFFGQECQDRLPAVFEGWDKATSGGREVRKVRWEAGKAATGIPLHSWGFD